MAGGGGGSGIGLTPYRSTSSDLPGVLLSQSSGKVIVTNYGGTSRNLKLSIIE